VLGLTKIETTVCPDMSHAVTAIVDAIIGLAAIWFGLREHFGTWYIDGVWGYVGAAIFGGKSRSEQGIWVAIDRGTIMEPSDCGVNMHRHVKLFAIACVLVAIGFVAGRYVMINQAAQYEADHP
jgi:hypothetical protein